MAGETPLREAAVCVTGEASVKIHFENDEKSTIYQFFGRFSVTKKSILCSCELFIYDVLNPVSRCVPLQTSGTHRPRDHPVVGLTFLDLPDSKLSSRLVNHFIRGMSKT